MLGYVRLCYVMSRYVYVCIYMRVHTYTRRTYMYGQLYLIHISVDTSRHIFAALCEHLRGIFCCCGAVVLLDPTNYTLGEQPVTDQLAGVWGGCCCTMALACLL